MMYQLEQQHPIQAHLLTVTGSDRKTTITDRVSTTADIQGGTMASVAITTGTLNDTPIGATTPNTASFTTLSTTNSADITASAGQDIILTALGNTAADKIVLNVNGGDRLTVSGSDGKTTITDLVATTADINAGTIDGTTIGSSTASAGTFTTLTSTDSVALASVTGQAIALTSAGTAGTDKIVLNAAGADRLTITGSDGKTTITDLVASTVDINAGTIDNTVIGGSTAAAGTFSTLTSSNSVALASVTGQAITLTSAGTAGTDKIVLNAAGTDRLTITGSDGKTTITDLVATTADINAGTIDGTVIGGATAAAGTFTTLTGTTVDLNGGAIDNTAIGATTASSGAFTTLTSTDSVALASVTGQAITLTSAGTAGTDKIVLNAAGTDRITVSGADGKTTITDLVATTADINAGTIDGTIIGGTTAAAGTFTALTATTSMDAGDIQISSSTVSSTATNADITLDANGSGEIVMNDNVRLVSKSFTCDSSKRGVLYFQEDVDASNDAVWICMKQTNSYTLVQLN